MSSDSEVGEDELLESSSTRPKGDKASNGYKLKNVLKLPRATTYTTQALYGTHSFAFARQLHAIPVLNAPIDLPSLAEQIIGGDIDLEPEYQRGSEMLSYHPMRMSSHLI